MRFYFLMLRVFRCRWALFKKCLGRIACNKGFKSLSYSLWLSSIVLALTSLASDSGLSPQMPASPRIDLRWSEMGDTLFHHLSVEQGLPNAFVTALAQDKDGFIWVGTQGGLARWDGYHFEHYTANLADPKGLPDPWVTVIRQDKQGRLWIGTNAGGLALFDRSKDQFLRVAVSASGTSHVNVRAILDDTQGNLWVGTRGGLDCFLADGKTVQHFRHENDDPNSLPSDRILSLLEDRLGRLWIGTNKGLVFRDKTSTQFKILTLPLAKAGDVIISSLTESSDGKLWIGTNAHGVFVFDAKREKLVALPLANLLNRAETKTAAVVINEMREAVPGKMWISTYEMGIVSVDITSLQQKMIRHDIALPSSLSDETVLSILRDQSGLVWVGTQNGLDRHDPNNLAVHTLLGGPSRPDSFIDTDFMSMASLPDGSIWFGALHKNIQVLDPITAQLKELPQSPDRPATKVFRCCVVRGKQVYFGTNNGVFRSDLDARKMEEVNVFPRLGTRVSSLALIDDDLWISGEDGLWVKSLKTAEPAFRPPGLDALKKVYVNEIVADNEGHIWIGSFHDGLYRYDQKTHALVHLTANSLDKTALPHNDVSNFLLDSRGWLWVGTQGGGIALLKNTREQTVYQFERITQAQGLPNDVVDKILEDNFGNVWVSTDEGIARIDYKTKAVDRLQRSEGVINAGFWSNSGAKTAHGDLMFGGVSGIVVIQPALYKKWDYHAPVVVTGLQLGGRKIPAIVMNSQAGMQKKLDIFPEANSLAVEFSALDFSAPEKNRYAYRLDGYDKAWIETDATRRLAAYTNLSPGNYQLRLRGSNRNGTWTEKEFVFPIHVIPAWYQTWWAYVVYALLTLGVLFMLIRWRLWALKEQNRVLESLVVERTCALELQTRELEKRTLDLEQSKKKLEEQSLTDPLTGLRNRRYLSISIDEDIAQVNRSYRGMGFGEVEQKLTNCDMVFIMVDLDYFKSVNDQYGHAAGDRVLEQASVLIKSATRDTDTVVRWGGEEFLVIARKANRVKAGVIAERIRKRIEEHLFDIGTGQTVHRTCSLGLAAYPFVRQKIELYAWEQVVDIADQCLYAAKRGGRNAWIGLSLAEHAEMEAQLDGGAFDVEQQITLGNIRVKTSLPGETKLDWSHGRLLS